MENNDLGGKTPFSRPTDPTDEAWSKWVDLGVAAGAAKPALSASPTEPEVSSASGDGQAQGFSLSHDPMLPKFNRWQGVRHIDATGEFAAFVAGYAQGMTDVILSGDKDPLRARP